MISTGSSWTRDQVLRAHELGRAPPSRRRTGRRSSRRRRGPRRRAGRAPGVPGRRRRRRRAARPSRRSRSSTRSRSDSARASTASASLAVSRVRASFAANSSAPEPRVAVGRRRQPGPQPVEVLVERGDGRVPDRLDLAAQRRLLAERALELGGEQRPGAGELPDRRLDVHPRHRAERRAGPAQPLRDGGQPTGHRRAAGRRPARSRGPATCRPRCPGWRPAGPTRSRAARSSSKRRACRALRRMSASTWSAGCSSTGSTRVQVGEPARRPVELVGLRRR